MFWVADGEQADFEELFGPSGSWQALVRCAEGYIDTAVSCESQIERRYRVFDYWVSHADFETFRERFAGRYRRLNELLLDEGLITRQWLVGTYYSANPDEAEGDALVPA
jgi:hypothetical protein